MPKSTNRRSAARRAGSIFGRETGIAPIFLCFLRQKKGGHRPQINQPPPQKNQISPTPKLILVNRIHTPIMKLANKPPHSHRPSRWASPPAASFLTQVSKSIPPPKFPHTAEFHNATNASDVDKPSRTVCRHADETTRRNTAASHSPQPRTPRPRTPRQEHQAKRSALRVAGNQLPSASPRAKLRSFKKKNHC